MAHQNDDKPQAVSDTISSGDNKNELDEQALDSVSGGVGSKSSSPFKNYGKGGPFKHLTGDDDRSGTNLGPKQDDPNTGGSND